MNKQLTCETFEILTIASLCSLCGFNGVDKIFKGNRHEMAAFFSKKTHKVNMRFFSYLGLRHLIS